MFHGVESLKLQLYWNKRLLKNRGTIGQIAIH